MACVTFAVEGRLGLIAPDRPPANAYDLDMTRDAAEGLEAFRDERRPVVGGV